MKMGSKV